ncbi:MAG TPA: hypothetical protein PKI45_05265 [Candidatus Omnitrophota bacterium]|nr:hypothetical protein [Candidatus Omnitrophota bacterium]
MKIYQMLGALLLALAVATVVGMVLDDAAYWNIYNYVTLIICVAGGAVLLKQK